MLEHDVESHLIKRVKQLGGKAYKWSSPSNRAVPDRLCCLPKAMLKLVECKAFGKTPTPLQAKVHKSLRELGYEVFVVDSKEKVDILYDMWKEELNDIK
ncbi:MAG: VRR-NUC domain-containing protein [Gammaproteobacteria bacterium]|nr:VRR-NUC domain-containing protein [Gammaproteobacteria bacterium]